MSCDSASGETHRRLQAWRQMPCSATATRCSLHQPASSAVQIRQKAVSDYFTSKQILPFVFADLLWGRNRSGAALRCFFDSMTSQFINLVACNRDDSLALRRMKKSRLSPGSLKTSWASTTSWWVKNCVIPSCRTLAQFQIVLVHESSCLKG